MDFFRSSRYAFLVGLVGRPERGVIMNMPDLVIRTAKKHVENYIQESQDVRVADREATDSRDCEAFLDLGIEAFQWLVRATRDVRSAAIRAADPAADAALAKEEDSLRAYCAQWLKPCGAAEAWIAGLNQRGLKVENIDDFRDCCERMRTIIAEDARMSELSARVPSHESLATIAIDPPREWTDEPSWTT
jgi:hypothetical protein